MLPRRTLLTKHTPSAAQTRPSGISARSSSVNATLSAPVGARLRAKRAAIASKRGVPASAAKSGSVSG